MVMVKGTITQPERNRRNNRFTKRGEQPLPSGRCLARKPFANWQTGFTALLAVGSMCLQGCDLAKPKQSPLQSFIPEECVERFIYEQLDLASFRNSLGPARSPKRRHFSDFSIPATKTENGLLEMETYDWFYSIQIVDRKDVNKDGLEDLIIEFFDSAKAGSYETFNRYLITRYSSTSGLVAIAFEVPDEGCEK